MGRILLLLWGSLAVALAQSEVGGASLNGTVTDASGAIIAGAKVTALNAGTGLSRDTITIEKAGFKVAKRSDL